MTLKIPISGRGGFSTRGEWQCQADSVDQCAQKLIEAGAPKELERLLDGRELLPLCGAEFTRNAAVMRFEDGSEAELALDTGILLPEMAELRLCASWSWSFCPAARNRCCNLPRIWPAAIN